MSNETAAAASEGQGERESEESGEESRVPKAKRAPNEPTNEEIRLHEITHTP